MKGFLSLLTTVTNKIPAQYYNRPRSGFMIFINYQQVITRSKTTSLL